MYTPTALLDDRVPLVDGRVSCTSCHVLKKDELLEAARGKGAEIACEATAELTVNNAGSALCMSCHSL